MATEILTEQSKPTKITYMTQARHMVLERVPPEELFDGKGGVREKPGTKKHYEPTPAGGMFAKFEFEPGQDVLPTAPDGSDEDVIAWIERHHLFGERIWKVDPEAPDPAPVLQEITRLAIQKDEDAIAAIHQAEQDGWERQVVLDTAETTLKALEGVSEPENGSQGP